jgi:glycosyltransferase involved in cell wall biosynthesis
MDTPPVFSIIIITYNRLSLLKRAVESVKSQSDSDWELLIIDNNSTDGTSEWVLSEIENDVRIHLYQINNENIIAKSRNLGIAKAKGKYTAFLDSDDEWMPTKLELSRKYFTQYSPIIGVCHGLFYDNGSSRIAVNRGPFSKDLTSLLLTRGNKLTPSAMVVKTEILQQIGGFSEAEDIVTAEDYDLGIRLSRIGSIKYIPEFLGVYYIHNDNLSGSLLRHYSATKKVVNCQIIEQQNLSKSFLKKIYWSVIRLIWTIRFARLRLIA